MDILFEFTRVLLRSLLDSIWWIIKAFLKLNRILLMELGLPWDPHPILILLCFRALISLGLYSSIMGSGSFDQEWYITLSIFWVLFMVPSLFVIGLRRIARVAMFIYSFAYPEKRQKAKNEEKPKYILDLSDDGETVENIEDLLYSNGDIAQTNHK